MKVSGSGPGSGTGILIGTNLSETLTYTGTSSGTATYTLIPDDGTCKGDPVDVVITIYPVADDSKIFAASPTTICENETTDVTITASESGVIYELKDGFNNSISGLYVGDGTDLVLTSDPLTLSPTTINVTATYPSALNCEVEANRVNAVSVS